MNKILFNLTIEYLPEDTTFDRPHPQRIMIYLPIPFWDMHIESSDSLCHPLRDQHLVLQESPQVLNAF